MTKINGTKINGTKINGTKINGTELLLIIASAVDDQPNPLQILSQILTDAGYGVAITKNDESAIQQIASKTPALILLDISQSEEQELELCQRLQENPATCHIPIILIIGTDAADVKIKGLSMGAVDFMTKPLQAEEILARISLHLELQFLTKQVQSQEVILEQKVAAKTSELAKSLQALQQTQIQLIQTEKMSILGQLVPSVAHEINNPVGCIVGNLSHLDNYLKDLFNLLELYQNHYPDPVEEIVEEIEAIELDYLTEDVAKILSSMTTATERLSHISTLLRSFFKADANSKVLFNIHEGIDSTLLILKSRLKAIQNRPDIKIIKEYGLIPEIECYPSQLNQVFINLIMNAIDAFDQASQGLSLEELKVNPHQITIGTKLVEANAAVAISIKDNGCGIAEEIQPHIFDYLFTTKSPEKATGLGLSISRQIIEEKHRGQLICHSSPGTGAEFIITIPVR